MQVHARPNATITPGFDDPVLQSQAMFRLIMSAMAQPGIWHEVPADLAPPAGLPRPAALTLLTLADYETPVWLPPSLRDGDAGAWLRFHSNCPLVDATAEAAFAVVHAGDTAARLADFSAGSDRFPDRSTTVLVVVGAREGGTVVELSGPGIEASRRISPAGLAPAFWQDVADNARAYPLGVDLLLMDASHILGLPRSTRVEGGG